MDYQLDYSDGTNTYSFAIIDVDLNHDGRMDSRNEDGKMLIQTAGPAIPEDAQLKLVHGSLQQISSVDRILISRFWKLVWADGLMR